MTDEKVISDYPMILFFRSVTAGVALRGNTFFFIFWILLSRFRAKGPPPAFLVQKVIV